MPLIMANQGQTNDDFSGEVSERLMEPVSKTGVPFLSGPRVRIPPSPFFAALRTAGRLRRNYVVCLYLKNVRW